MLDTLAAPQRRSVWMSVAFAVHCAIVVLAMIGRRNPIVIEEPPRGPTNLIFYDQHTRTKGRGPSTSPQRTAEPRPPRKPLRRPLTAPRDAPPAAAPAPAAAAAPAADEPVGDEPPGDEPVARPVGGGGGGAEGPAERGEDVWVGDPMRLTRARPACDPPQMPEAARLMGITGAVVASYVVEPDGHVSRVEIANPSAPQVLIDAVRTWLSECRFDPARVDSRPVRIRVTQPFLFKIQ